MSNWEVQHGDCRDVMRSLPPESVDAIVSDPPYGLSFMGKEWDQGVPGVEFWTEALRVAKPGAHLVAFGGTRTYHRLAVAIEDAGWEVRDCLSWLYGSGFPKSLDVSKQIDKHGGTPPAWFGPWFRAWRESQGITQKQVATLFPSKTGNLTGCVANWELGFNLPTPEQFNLIREAFGLPFDSIEAAEREVVGRREVNGEQGTAGGYQNGLASVRGADITTKREIDITAPATDAAKRWHGWGTALKPAWEPIILARKPLTGTVAANVTQYGTGAINVDGCRIGTSKPAATNTAFESWRNLEGRADRQQPEQTYNPNTGRWPANVLLDEDAAGMLDEQTGALSVNGPATWRRNKQDAISNPTSYAPPPKDVGETRIGYGDTGGASRFFFVAREGQCENVNIAGQDLSQPNQREDFAPAPASLAHSRERCQRGRDCTADCTDCTRHLNLAPSAGAMDNTGTIQTIPTCCESCGSALPVTDASINQASAEKVADASDPVSGTRFLYTSKVSRKEREAGLDGMPERDGGIKNDSGRGFSERDPYKKITTTNHHPTVKPIALMRWLCRLVTPPNGLILDPFNGSGSTGCAAVLEGFRYLGAELEPEYVEIARRRIAYWESQRSEPDLFG